jgi:outer membrane lipopolysaccharide assembly protein LptE/RlpB
MCGKIAITLTRMCDFHINNLYKFTYHFSTIILHEENNSLTLNVLTLLQQ